MSASIAAIWRAPSVDTPPLADRRVVEYLDKLPKTLRHEAAPREPAAKRSASQMSSKKRGTAALKKRVNALVERRDGANAPLAMGGAAAAKDGPTGSIKTSNEARDAKTRASPSARDSMHAP